MENNLKLDKNKETLEKMIIRILSFFDLFEYPLTAFEIWNYLDKKEGLSGLMSTLESHPEIISQRNGFYFLSGRETIVATRLARYNYSNRKLKIARCFARLFGFFPGVQAVYLANTIGAHNLRDKSDIDFFIITAPGGIWRSRLYCAGLAKLLGRRPTAANKRDKLCLSFYIAADHLSLADLRLPGGDPYLDYWQRGLVLLYNKKGMHEKFLAANAAGGDGFRPAAVAPAEKSFWEKSARRWQMKIMPAELKNAAAGTAATGQGVVLSDQVLKLYWPDKRREFLNKFNHNLHELLQKIN